MNVVKFNDHLLAWGTAITAVLIAIPLCYAAISDHVEMRQEIAAVKALGDDHEGRLRVLEKETAETAANVRWIRGAMEKKNLAAN